LIIIILSLSFLGFSFYLIGFWGILNNRRNILLILLAIELILLGVNLILLSASLQLDDLVGQILALMILLVAGAESSIGLSIMLAYYRMRGSIRPMYQSNGVGTMVL